MNFINKANFNRFTYILVLLFLAGCSKENPDSETDPIPFDKTSKVIGYLPSYRFSASPQIEYCKLTHLNLSFAHPDADGNLIMPDISSVISDARSANPDIIISISLAGGALSQEQANNWSNLLDNAANRPPFIEKIINYVNTNNLDGVDVDLEWDHVTIGYSDFVTELKTAIVSHHKLLTAALPNNTRFSNISDAALDAFDFINIMSYDATGPWNPNNTGQHSSIQFSNDGIDFWKNTVKIPKDRLTLGVPFYGYNFDQNPVGSFTYGQMVVSDPALADMDVLGKSYYNGRPTIEAKVNLALNKVSGIMIWELGQDSFDQYSLLSTIHKKFTSLKTETTGLCGNVPE